MGEDNQHAIIATTMVAFAFSSILTGASAVYDHGAEGSPERRLDVLPTRSAAIRHPDRFLPPAYPCWVRVMRTMTETTI